MVGADGRKAYAELVGATARTARERVAADKRSMRWAVESVLVRGPQAQLDAIGTISSDLSTAGNVAHFAHFALEPTDDQDLSFRITLAQR